jgi:hypothetical protein
MDLYLACEMAIKSPLTPTPGSLKLHYQNLNLLAETGLSRLMPINILWEEIYFLLLETK